MKISRKMGQFLRLCSRPSILGQPPSEELINKVKRFGLNEVLIMQHKKIFFLISIALLAFSAPSLSCGRAHKTKERNRKAYLIEMNEHKKKGIGYKIWIDIRHSRCNCNKYKNLCSNSLGDLPIFICVVMESLSQAKTGKLSKYKIFESGPHTANKFVNDAHSTFGHYNKKFIIWVGNNMVPAYKDQAFRKFSQPIYDSYSDFIRTFYVTIISLNMNHKFKTQELHKYIEDIEAGTYFHNNSDYYYFLDKTIGSVYQNIQFDGHTVRHAIKWWLRRTIDGSENEFKVLLEKIIKTYDREFLTKTESVITFWSKTKQSEQPLE
jgi:hypothetical protein